jgi:hypothetical protein
VAVLGSTLLSVMDRLAFEIIPQTAEDVLIVNDNIGELWAKRVHCN